MESFTKKHNTYRIVFFIFCFLVIISRTIFVSIYDNTRARNQVYGDGYSDINTISSAKYFLDSGFTGTTFLPVHDYYPDASHPQVYTHYPALPNILAGIYATVFQSYSEPVLRIFPVVLAALFFFFIYHVLLKVTGNANQAFIGGSVIVLSNYFIAWADNLHQHLYGEFLKWIYFYLLYRYHETGAKNKIMFIPMLLIMLLEVNISFEQPVYLGVLTLGFSVIYKRSILTFETISAGLAVLGGFGLHMLQNAIYLGSWDLAMEDMKNALFLRTAGVDNPLQKGEAQFSPSDYWQIPFNWFNRMERYFLFPGWAMLFIAFLALKELKTNNKRLYQIVWALFFASVAWTICMAQHAFIHTFTNKHFSIFYGMVAAVGLPVFYNKLKQAFASRNYTYGAFYGLLAAYMVAMFITQQLFPLYIRFGIGYSLLEK
jgi:hypothetical protein